MSFNYGFYNSRNGDRKYDALDVSRIFDGIIKDGVFMNVGNQFKVAVLSDMQLTVDSGRAWFNHTWSYNDSKFVVTITDSDVLLPRIDAIILEINEDNRMNTVKVLTGTAATVPAKPTLTNTTTVHQYPLAYITIPANSSSVTAGNIENTVGTSACPFVTGVLQGMNIDNLIAQWDAQFMTWFDKMKGQLNEDAAGNLQIQIDDLQIQIDDLQVQINGFSDEIANIFGETVATDANTATGLAFIVDGNTLNTPYKAGETGCQNGIIINSKIENGGYNTQLAILQGSITPWTRFRNGNTWGDWDQMLTLGNTTPGQIGAMSKSDGQAIKNTADNAMPRSGGTFTGNVAAYGSNRSGGNIRNIETCNSSWGAVSTNKLVTLRK